jgi:hypothetical protein
MEIIPPARIVKFDEVSAVAANVTDRLWCLEELVERTSQ